jgi:hypothetical protein
MKCIGLTLRILALACLVCLVSNRNVRAEEATLAVDSGARKTSTSPVPALVDETSDSKWHLYGTAYLWFPGIHGAVGVRGFDTGVHISAVDLASNLRFGIMGVVTPTYNRWSLPVDYFFVRLRDDKAVPFNPNYQVQAKMTASIVTPKVNYLLLKNPKLKIYATAGPRIWHEGTTLDLVPTIAGQNLYHAANWADFVAGGRFDVPLGPKGSIVVLGDAGGGGATLDYQLAGFVNYQVKPKLALQLGWRDLTVHYGNNGNLFNGTMQGIVFGLTYKFK